MNSSVFFISSHESLVIKPLGGNRKMNEQTVETLQFHDVK